MRESNFAFPAQNKASVCITSQLYDRRALDTTSALPLFNSLTHLTYLTSTSPRIREIMTMDGGLERLVRMLHEFCLCPPPPDNPALFYGLAPPNSRPPKLTPTLNPTSFDKHAAYRFSLAFQCVVNIGVRGSEPIRTRVVQAGTLDVVGCILEAWLANKGFAVGPSSSASGLPRETREQRHARRQQQRQRAAGADTEELTTALRRQQLIQQEVPPPQTPTPPIAGPSGASDTDISTDQSTTNTPLRSSTPTGAVVVPTPARDRSGTIIGRPIWDRPPSPTSRPDTETEDDDVDMNESNPPVRHNANAANTGSLGRAARAVGIVAPTAEAAIIINDTNDAQVGGVEDGIVSLDQNDDFAMGAPPGAPGAIVDEQQRTNTTPEATPRAGVVALPEAPMTRTGTIRGGRAPMMEPLPSPSRHHHHHHSSRDTAPYRDEDVLLSLQLLAYLSKYPHVRQAFYKPRQTFHPASVHLAQGRYGIGSASSSKMPIPGPPLPSAAKEKETSSMNFFKSLRGKEKEKERERQAAAAAAAVPAPSNTRMTNVFSLVERFTFRPSSTETELQNPPPKLPPEIQYWAGVIMRNACRKDDSRGGIRQCANMLCGRWEEYPREFAKCRRCRKAKYCGKECQSTAWSEGHRFWCSAKEGDEDRDPASGEHHHHHHTSSHRHHPQQQIPIAAEMGGGGNVPVGGRRERGARERTLGNVGFDPAVGTGRTTTVRASRVDDRRHIDMRRRPEAEGDISAGLSARRRADTVTGATMIPQRPRPTQTPSSSESVNGDTEDGEEEEDDMVLG